VPTSQYWGAVHLLSQPPQWASEESVSTQEPPQSVCPLWHSHLPPEQDSPSLHLLSQPPQCSDEVLVFTQFPPQEVSPSLHALASHLPSLQASPSLQAVSQAPQWSLEVLVSTQAEPQRVCSEAHLGRQALLTHSSFSVHSPLQSAGGAGHAVRSVQRRSIERRLSVRVNR